MCRKMKLHLLLDILSWRKFFIQNKLDNVRVHVYVWVAPCVVLSIEAQLSQVYDLLPLDPLPPYKSLLKYYTKKGNFLKYKYISWAENVQCKSNGGPATICESGELSCGYVDHGHAIRFET